MAAGSVLGGAGASGGAVGLRLEARTGGGGIVAVDGGGGRPGAGGVATGGGWGGGASAGGTEGGTASGCCGWLWPRRALPPLAVTLEGPARRSRSRVAKALAVRMVGRRE